MMKHEFEEMVGKEVTVETFEMYEAMYMALPEHVSKQEFVKMLNIKAIPENPEATARCEANERRKQAIKEKIAGIKEEIERLKRFREMYKTQIDDFEKREYRWYGKRIESEKARIAELKFIMG